MNKWAARALLFVAVGLGVVLFLYLHATFGVDPKSAGPAVLSLVMFGLLVQHWKEYWRYAKYWAILGVTFIVHFAVVRVLGTHLPRFPLAIFGVAATLEFGAISWLIIVVCK